MKRILSLLLALLLLVNLAVPAMAAEGDNNQITLSVDKTDIKVGDMVYVTVGGDSAYTAMSTISIKLFYDGAAFELDRTASTAGKENDFFEVGKAQTDKNTGKNYVTVSFMDLDGETDVAIGEYATVAFLAKAKADGAAFSLGSIKVADDTLAQVTYPVKAPEAVTVAVVNTPAEPSSYTFTLAQPENGTVTLSGVTEGMAAAGSEITVNAVPDENYVLDTVSVKCGETDVPVTDNKFTMPAGHVTVTVTFKQKPNSISNVEAAHPNIVVKEDGVLQLAMYEGVSEQLRLAVENLLPDAESDQIIVWSSSDSAIAEVDQNGKITAKSLGTAYITATATDPAAAVALVDEADSPASATVEVVVSQVSAGYTVTMAEDTTVKYDEKRGFELPVTIGNTDAGVTEYHAYDLTIKYDPNYIFYNGSVPEGFHIAKDSNGNQTGTIHITNYGEAKTVNIPAFTLRFYTYDNSYGTTAVKVTAAKVGTSKEALEQDASVATLVDNVTIVQIDHAVDLPGTGVLVGKDSAVHGEDYTFRAEDLNYDYDFSGSTMGGEAVEVINNGDGTFTIKNVTGRVMLAATRKAKQFSVTLGDDMTGETSATYKTDYVATLTKAEGYSYQPIVTIGGKSYTDFTYDDATGKITIPGADITGAIVFDSRKEAVPENVYTVTFTGNRAGDASGAAYVKPGDSYTFTVNKAEGLTYTVTYKNKTLTESNGKYTIASADIDGNLTITINAASDVKVAVHKYIALDEQSILLITAEKTMPAGNVLTYDDKAMIYSNQYNAWCYLVFDDGSLTDEAAAAKIGQSSATKIIVSKTCDVNETGNVDINDAQLVYDMYNAKYPSFKNASMEKFLKADVNGSKFVDVTDAAAIISEIIAAKNK